MTIFQKFDIIGGSDPPWPKIEKKNYDLLKTQVDEASSIDVILVQEGGYTTHPNTTRSKKGEKINSPIQLTRNKFSEKITTRPKKKIADTTRPIFFS